MTYSDRRQLLKQLATFGAVLSAGITSPLARAGAGDDSSDDDCGKLVDGKYLQDADCSPETKDNDCGKQKNLDDNYRYHQDADCVKTETGGTTEQGRDADCGWKRIPLEVHSDEDCGVATDNWESLDSDCGESSKAGSNEVHPDGDCGNNYGLSNYNADNDCQANPPDGDCELLSNDGSGIYYHNDGDDGRHTH